MDDIKERGESHAEVRDSILTKVCQRRTAEAVFLLPKVLKPSSKNLKMKGWINNEKKVGKHTLNTIYGCRLGHSLPCYG